MAGNKVTYRECKTNVKGIHDKIDTFTEVVNDKFDKLINNDIAHMRADFNEMRRDTTKELSRIKWYLALLLSAVFGSSVLKYAGVLP